MPELHVLRVFTAPGGDHGNGLGVFLQGRDVPDGRRQEVAKDLGFAETVFVDDADRGEVRIFAPDMEMPFAGHPSVGTAWLLRESGADVPALRPPAGEIRVRHDGDITWIAARPEWSPPFEYSERESAEVVDGLRPAEVEGGWVYVWAWEDEGAGRIRARSFVSDAGIPEDEATGSAALALCAQLKRPIQIKQGRGSEIFARPVDEGFVEVGGRAVLDETRPYLI